MVNDWLLATEPLIIGHRGASGDAPENTLAAIGLALEQGADGVEIDVHLSADGHPVIIHDQQVSRTTNGHGLVTELNLKELQLLDAGNGQQIPTLDQVFEAFGPALLYNLELKGSGWRDRGLVSTVIDGIERFNLDRRVIISSFSPLLVRRSQRNCSPQTACALLRWRGLASLGYWLADGLADHPHHSMIDASYMAWAHRRGYRVHTWTVDDPERARELVDLGVHALITNRPLFIRLALKQAPEA